MPGLVLVFWVLGSSKDICSYVGRKKYIFFEAGLNDNTV